MFCYCATATSFNLLRYYAIFVFKMVIYNSVFLIMWILSRYLWFFFASGPSHSTETRKEQCEILISSGKTNSKNNFSFSQFIFKNVHLSQIRFEAFENLSLHLHSEWLNVGRSKLRFLMKYNDWLDTLFHFRSVVSFEKRSERTKRKKQKTYGNLHLLEI